jgi:hypothetical protein
MFSTYYLDSQIFFRSPLGYTLLGGADAVEGESVKAQPMMSYDTEDRSVECGLCDQRSCDLTVAQVAR